MNTNEIVALIVAVLGSGVLATIVNVVYDIFKTKKRKLTASELADRVLLEERINYLGRLYISQEFIYADDKDRLKRMWTIYHEDLKGNGYLDSVMHEVSKLEVKWR